MSLLVGIHSLSKSYGTQKLFNKISFGISQTDRIGLLGPNGSGKTTLLKILNGLEQADDGTISKRQNLRLGYACQDPDFPEIDLEQAMLRQPLQGDSEELVTRARILLGKAHFVDFTQDASKLSGGWKKRLDIAKALMHEPDLLFLDEPTNHLDIEGILWLEKLLLREKIAYVVVSHDRYFLENVANKIIEINACYPEGLFISEGNMTAYTARKEAFLAGQLQQQRGLASVVRDEVAWLKKSPKARTTKAQSRVNKTYELMEELSDIKNRNKTEKVNIEFTASERQTRKLLVARNIGKSLGGKELFKGVDLTLSPGSRLGIVGKNGTGKTSMLRLLAGEISPDMGTIKYAEDLRIVYFDQHREHIPGDVSLRRALAPNGDQVVYRGASIHVNGWAKKFLFTPERLELPVSCLSGGERARILMAKLMLEPADLLFLDEPTNDLDIPTLEVIEESLKEFPGALVLISHDRCLMDKICTQILGLGAQGEEQGFFSTYKQWEQALQKGGAQQKKEAISKTLVPVLPVVGLEAPQPQRPKKLSYLEQRELESMEKVILKVEEELAALQRQVDSAQMAGGEPLQKLYSVLASKHAELEALFDRWQELSDL